MKNRISRRALLSLLAMSATLPACGSKEPDPLANIHLGGTSHNELYEALQKYAAGFKVGSPSARAPVFVLFDPQCPHCGTLWNDVAAFRDKAHMVWVPVALLAARSNLPQGAKLLQAADAVKAMDEHEQSLLAGKGGISASDADDAYKLKVKANSAILRHFGLTGVPVVVSKTANGVSVKTGVPPVAELRVLLGVS